MKQALLAALLVATPFFTWSAADEMGEAVAVLEQAVKDHPQNAELYVHLGFACRKADRLEDAQRAFEEAARLNPKKAEAFYMLGLIYEKKGLKAKADSAWKSCLDSASDESMKETASRHLHHLQN